MKMNEKSQSILINVGLKYFNFSEFMYKVQARSVGSVH